MAGLARGEVHGLVRGRLLPWRVGLLGKKSRKVSPAGATVVRSESGEDGLGRLRVESEQMLAQEFVLAWQGDSGGPDTLLVEPVGELEEGKERGG